tara:strand:- start:39197 stop:40135 length:939 start_codon:yes stop_codon:yes gene_type:complete
MKSKNIFKFTISPDPSLRLDQLISQELPEYSRSRIKNWIKDKKIMINGQTCLPKDKVKELSVIEVELDTGDEIDIISENIPINVIYEDSDIIIVNKNSCMVTHTAPGNYSGTLQNALLHHFPDLKKLPRAGIIHRLDKQTSGMLIICKNLISQFQLSKDLQDRKIKKKYTAIVSGSLNKNHIIEKPIGRHPVNRKKMTVISNGKYAKTIIDSYTNGELGSVLNLEIVTGRTHQIRVHLSDIGHPVIGDYLYGFKKSAIKKNPELIELMANFEGIALHACHLEFRHPTNKRDFAIECLPGDTFNGIRSLVLEK